MDCTDKLNQLDWSAIARDLDDGGVAVTLPLLDAETYAAFQAMYEEAFFALVESLQKAMDKQNVPFSAQSKLLAILAPMHRDIVNQ